MPLLGTRAAASARGFGMFAPKGGGYLWAAYNTDIGNNQGRSAIAADSSGNIYVGAIITVSSVNYGYIAKYNKSGTVLWERKVTSLTPFKIALDSALNVYVAGSDFTTGDGVLLKYDNNGSLQWQRKFRTNSSCIAYGLAIDSSDNLYVAGQDYYNTISKYYAIVIKFNSSGVIQWQRKLIDDTAVSATFYGVAVDGSGNVYCTGNAYSGSIPATYFLTAKYNSSGTLSWAKRLYATGVSTIGYSVATDSSGNVYVGGRGGDSAAGVNKGVVAKYNSSGTLQWQNFIENQFGFINDITVDSNNDLYSLGFLFSGGYKTTVYKFNASSAVQWQREFNNGTNQYCKISATAPSTVNVVFYADTPSNFVFSAFLPKDGSASSGTAFLTLSTNSTTISSGNMSDDSSSAASSAGSTVDSAGSLTDSSVAATVQFASVT